MTEGGINKVLHQGDKNSEDWDYIFEERNGTKSAAQVALS